MKVNKHVDRLELIGSVLWGSLWSLTSRSPSSTILKAGYFAEKWPEAGLKKGDRINLVCDYDSDEPTFATLAVISAGKKGEATVKQL